jgi:hypothetical protein
VAAYRAMYGMFLVCRGGETVYYQQNHIHSLSASAYRNIPYIARYAATPQPSNEVILLIFYESSFSKERSVLPEDGRITETCSS